MKVAAGSEAEMLSQNARHPTVCGDAAGDMIRKMAEKTCMKEDAPHPRDAHLDHCIPRMTYSRARRL